MNKPAFSLNSLSLNFSNNLSQVSSFTYFDAFAQFSKNLFGQFRTKMLWNCRKERNNIVHSDFWISIGKMSRVFGQRQSVRLRDKEKEKDKSGIGDWQTEIDFVRNDGCKKSSDICWYFSIIINEIVEDCFYSV